MTLDECVRALAGLQAHVIFFVDDMGMLRGIGRASTCVLAGAHYCPLTALASARHPGQWWNEYLDWQRAAEALGLTLADASALVSAADNDRHADPALARALRVAVGIPEDDPSGTPP